ncbi:MAG TPA: Hint domain-containing protein, partial [Acetobacteraceae bacterium]|nr:Hint domain-containing protein [Acetobacteraceae bacterium]
FMPCFAAGVLILTARGEVPVEEMRVGDEVVLGRGGLAPVQWIGRRHIDLARHPRPDSVQPVRLQAGSIIDGVPRRDLYLSPDHALYLDGILVPSKALLNGETIARLSVSQVVYYHIELAAHDVIFADGTPVETYLDCGNRGAFENARGAMHLHADFASAFRHEASYAPVWEAGDKVEAIRARLLARCTTKRSADPAIRLVQGCHKLALQWASENMLHAGLAADSGDVMVMSRNAIPGEISPDPRDRRRLGVALGEILLGGPTGIRRIGLDHLDLVTGWHEVEAGQRWTDGAAIIPARLLGDAIWIRLHFVAKLSYAQAA